MHSPENIRQKALRQYNRFLEAWLRDEDFFPLRLSVGPVDVKDYVSLQDYVDTLNKQSKTGRGYGYNIESSNRRTRHLGQQTIPHHIVFETTNDYLRYIGEGKTGEFKNFVADVETIRSVQPGLETWLQENFKDLIKYQGEWRDLLLVCQYFSDNPLPQQYVRELPIEVHTKFIETHQSILDKLLQQLLPQSAYHLEADDFNSRYGIRNKSPLIRVRLLDSSIKSQSSIPFDEFAIPITTVVNTFLSLEHCIIIENELNFLTVPLISRSIAIWGEGYKAEVLARVQWFHDVDIVYWGDIDVQGFQILSNLRSYFPHIRSVMMNQTILDTFGQYIVEGTPTNVRALFNLSSEERRVYQHVLENNLRLEQEHISQDFVNQVLSDMFL